MTKAYYRIMLIAGLAAVLLASGAHGLDVPLPINLGFRLGFTTQLIPGPNDTSQALGLGVVPEKIMGDKKNLLVVAGTIVNYSDLPCIDVDMHFAVTSYIGTGVSRGRATVVPSTIPPGGTATFSAQINLDSEKPRFAMYTISAKTPIVLEPEPVAPAIVPSVPEAEGEIEIPEAVEE